MGADAIVWFDRGENSLSFRTMDEVTLRPGDEIAPGIDIARASLFDEAGRRL